MYNAPLPSTLDAHSGIRKCNSVFMVPTTSGCMESYRCHQAARLHETLSVVMMVPTTSGSMESYRCQAARTSTHKLVPILMR